MSAKKKSRKKNPRKVSRIDLPQSSNFEAYFKIDDSETGSDIEVKY